MTKKKAKKKSNKSSTTLSSNQPTNQPATVSTKHDELFDLYTTDSDDEGTVDMTTLDQKLGKRNLLMIFVVAILMLSAIAAILGYIVFGSSNSGVNQGAMEFTMTTDGTVASGDELTITITYKNTTSSEIDHGAIEVLFPQGFYFRSSDPQPASSAQNRWEINNVPSGAEGTITITGQLVGQKDDSKNITALFTYTPINFNSDFQVSTHTTVVLDESIITLITEVPQRAHSGEEIQYLYSFTNTSTLPLANLKAMVKYPDGFKPISADPTASQNNNLWLFEEVAAGETKQVVIKGTLNGDGGTDQEFLLQVGLQEPNGFFNVQAEQSAIVLIVNPELSLRITAPEFAQAGNDIEYTIEVANTSDANISDLKLALQFSGKVLTTSEIELEAIEELKPGKSTTVTHTSKIKDNVGDTKEIVANVNVVSANVDGEEIEFEQTAEATTTLQGAVSAKAEARYYDDDLTKLGSGPLPPMVGSTTEYIIRWTITASGGDMNTIELTTNLPAAISYVSSSDNAISHSNGTVTAALDSLTNGETTSIDFKVSATPTKEDVNKLLVLTKEAVVTATDANSGEVVQTSVQQVTSSLANDPGASDTDGTVVKKK